MKLSVFTRWLHWRSHNDRLHMYTYTIVCMCSSVCKCACLCACVPACVCLRVCVCVRAYVCTFVKTEIAIKNCMQRS